MQESLLNVSASRFWAGELFPLVAWTLFSLSVCYGCTSNSVPPERNDAANAAKIAIEAYDADGNGVLSTEEIKKSPALESAMDRLDSDRNRSVTADEIAQRMASYDSQSDFIPVMVMLKSGRNPIEMATVTFEPEAFMGDDLQSFTGVSNTSGVVNLVGKVEKTPGLPLGFYRITIKRDGGAETTHGCEIADDVPSVGRMNFSL